jgi:antitoxin component of MazEF toxin-antitoxin module
MELVKIRRVGNSSVVTLPRAVTGHGFDVGTYVLIEERDGEIVLRRATVTEAVRNIAREVVEEDQEALEYLAAYDRGEVDSEPGGQRT